MSPKDIAVWVPSLSPSPEHEYPREALGTWGRGFRMQGRGSSWLGRKLSACQNCWFTEAEEPLQTRSACLGNSLLSPCGKGAAEYQMPSA